MPELTPFWAQSTFWISLASLGLAGWSSVASWRSVQTAKRALAISEGHEERRRPQLGIYRAKGFRRYEATRQVFSFLVSITNPTDIDNSIAMVELQITYALDGGIKAACRISHNPEFAEAVESAAGLAHIISLPTRVDAHQTVAGWLIFSLNHDLVAGRTIDTQKIILEDSHGVHNETDAIFVTDWTCQTQDD